MVKTIGLIALAGSAIVASVVGLRSDAGIDVPKKGVRPGGIGKSMDILAEAKGRGHDLAMFGAGCFWGVESEFRGFEGVVATAVGYSGGHTEKPTYEEVCAKGTGHAEVVLIEFDPKKATYAKLVEVFYGIHDPTQKDRQGPDIGSNYRSAIYTFGDEQARIAREVTSAEQMKLNGKTIHTEIAPAKPFWMAEDYHQQYFEKRGVAPTCRIK